MDLKYDKEALNELLSRRDFLKLTGRSALALGAFSLFGDMLYPGRAAAAMQNTASDIPIRIFHPTTFFPAITAPGDDITASISIPEGVQITGGALVPRGAAGNPIALNIVETGRTADAAGFLMSPVSIPDPGPYTFELSVDNGRAKAGMRKPGAVWVREKISDTFTFAIVADYHVGDNRGKRIAPKMNFDKLRARVLKELDAMKPDFVLVVGDIVYQPGQYAKDYGIFHSEFLNGLNAPAFVAPGNHDLMNLTVGRMWNIQGFDFWDRYMGPLYYSFSYGRHRFIGMNTYDKSENGRDISMMLGLEKRKAIWSAASGGMGATQFEWLKNELSDAGKRDQRISVFGHHTVLGDMDGTDSVTGEELVHPDTLIKTLVDSGVDNYFYGHRHRNQSDERDSLALTCTGTAGSDLGGDAGWGFRLVEASGGRMSSRYVEIVPHPRSGRKPAGAAKEQQ